MDRVSGEVKNIIYRNSENGYTVLELMDASGEEITAVGTLPLANVGERVELEGAWTDHPVYGPQFKAESCTILAPATLSSLVSYLSSGLIRGVGESTAKSIVATFGMDTLNVLENQPERLSEVFGIGPMKARMIAESYSAQRGLRDVMLALQGYGVTVNQAMKLYKLYGDTCLIRLRENPYRLVEDIENIGFKTADKIAAQMGIAHDSPFRLRAGIRYTLQAARQQGHTYLPRERLVEVCAQLLETEVQPVERVLESMIIAQELSYKLVGSVDAVFLPHLMFMEQDCARRLLRLAGSGSQVPAFTLNADIARLEQEIGVQLAPQQKKAVRMALSSGAMVITGGPGTGKTTILRFIIHLAERMGLSCALCAPTGRAAKRMSEATGVEAQTIHRLLEYGVGSESFTKNEQDPILADIVIVDEMSMVDVPLLHALIKALAPGTKLIMVGDSDQLPSVGPGNVLRDIVQSGKVPLVRLSEIFRQSGRSAIVTNAHAINHGVPPELNAQDGEFGFEQITAAEDILRRVIGLCSGKTGKLGTQDPFKDVQVLAPMKKGLLGVYNLNARLQEALNPPAQKKRERRFGDTIFREGDKVMQVKNNYRLAWTRGGIGRETETGMGVFNGDIGTVMKIDNEEQTLEVLFDDERCAVYDFSMLDELQLAYCVSIHKSQGSEFPIVLLPLAGGPPMLMTRNLLYTAVTRARKQVYIVGHRETVYRMTQNAEERKRYSALASFLCDPIYEI